MKRLSATLFTSLLIVGCATKGTEQMVMSPAPQSAPSQPMEVKDENAKPTPPPFSQKVLVGAIRDIETNDGYRKVQVSVKNLTGESIRTLYRFRWFDDKGIEVSAPNMDMWHSRLIMGGDEIVLSAVAPEKNCPDVKLLIKEAVRK